MLRLIPVLLVGCGATRSPVERDLPCDETQVDLWRVVDPAAGLITVRVDTIAEETLFDPDAILYDVEAWGEGQWDVRAGNVLGYGDDEVPCSYPPPDYACPQILANVEPTDDLLVVVGVVGSCADTDIAYELSVEHESGPAKVKYHGRANTSSFVSTGG